jgi:quercetin dioxygenase-like cupin family protein
MAVKGGILENRHTGDRVEFLETSGDTEGDKLTLKMVYQSKGKRVPNHIHELQDENFEVLSGNLTLWLDGETHILSKGDRMMLPKNTPHNHYNSSNKPVICIQTVTPALDFEYLFETLFGLANDGEFTDGKAGFFQEIVLLKYLESKTYRADIPIRLQQIIMNSVGPIGRLFGYRAIYKTYSGFEK